MHFDRYVDNLFQDLLELLKKEKNIPLLVQLETNFKIISFEHGEIHFDLTEETNVELVSNLSTFLSKHTNRDWKLIQSNNKHAKTFLNLKEEADLKLKNIND